MIFDNYLTMDQIVKLNVGGKKFDTTYDVLIKSKLFKDLLDNPTIDYKKRIFIARSSRVFEHVLAYMIDNRHPFPKKYTYELDHFGINYAIAEKDSPYIVKTRHFFCNKNDCEIRCRAGEDYCNDHKCEVDGCHSSKCDRYCPYHETEPIWQIDHTLNVSSIRVD